MTVTAGAVMAAMDRVGEAMVAAVVVVAGEMVEAGGAAEVGGTLAAMVVTLNAGVAAAPTVLEVALGSMLVLEGTFGAVVAQVL